MKAQKRLHRPKTSGKRKRFARRKITANSLNEKEMDELAAGKVEQKVGDGLLSSLVSSHNNAKN